MIQTLPVRLKLQTIQVTSLEHITKIQQELLVKTVIKTVMVRIVEHAMENTIITSMVKTVPHAPIIVPVMENSTSISMVKSKVNISATTCTV